MLCNLHSFWKTLSSAGTPRHRYAGHDFFLLLVMKQLSRRLSMSSRHLMHCLSFRTKLFLLCIPLVHTGCLAIITHWAGCNITDCNRLSLPVLETAKQGLQAMHNLHVSRGDIHSRNMLLHESGIMFCDLGQSTNSALSGAYEQDLSMLDEAVPATQVTPTYY